MDQREFGFGHIWGSLERAGCLWTVEMSVACWLEKNSLCAMTRNLLESLYILIWVYTIKLISKIGR